MAFCTCICIIVDEKISTSLYSGFIMLEINHFPVYSLFSCKVQLNINSISTSIAIDYNPTCRHLYPTTQLRLQTSLPLPYQPPGSRSCRHFKVLITLATTSVILSSLSLLPSSVQRCFPAFFPFDYMGASRSCNKRQDDSVTDALVSPQTDQRDRLDPSFERLHPAELR